MNFIMSFGKVLGMVLLASLLWSGVQFLLNKKKKKSPALVVLLIIGLLLGTALLCYMLGS